jgi:hypothetical protein
MKGLTLNFSRRGVSVSVGPRGAKTTFGHGRIRRTVGLPGTGLFYTQVSRTSDAEAMPRRVPAHHSGVSNSAAVREALLALESIAEPESKIKALDEGFEQVWQAFMPDLKREAKKLDYLAVVELVDGYDDALDDLDGMAEDVGARLWVETHKPTATIESRERRLWLANSAISTSLTAARTYLRTVSIAFMPSSDKVASRHEMRRAFRDFEEAYADFAAAMKDVDATYVPRCTGLVAATDG